MNDLIDDLIVTCDMIVDTQNCIVINLSNGINYLLNAVVLLANACLTLLAAILVKHCMKLALTISC